MEAFGKKHETRTESSNTWVVVWLLLILFHHGPPEGAWTRAGLNYGCDTTDFGFDGTLVVNAISVPP